MIPRKKLNTRISNSDVTRDPATGETILGTFTNGTIKASVHPVSVNELQLLPEGKREAAQYKIITSSKLNTSLENNGSSDEVQINSNWYEIIMALPWQNNIINHNVYVLQGKTDK